MHCLLYSSAGCHLCEEAVEILLQVHQNMPALSWREVEISNEDALIERYGIRIPVLAIPGVENDLGWPFSPRDVYEFVNTHTNT